MSRTSPPARIGSSNSRTADWGGASGPISHDSGKRRCNDLGRRKGRMKILASARIALKALRVNRLRSALTMLGIIIGVAAVLALGAVGSRATPQGGRQGR